MNFFIIDYVFFIFIFIGMLFNFLGDRRKYIFKFLYLSFLFLSGYYICSDILMYSRDAILYVDWFSRIDFSSVIQIFQDGKDILFQFIVKFIQEIFSTDNFYVFYICFLLIGYFKFKYVSTISNGVVFFLLLWLIYGQTFILYEVTQIRGGLAIALVSYAIVRDLFKKNKFLTYTLYIVAPFLHISTLIVLLLFFVTKIFGKFLIRRNIIIYILVISFLLKIIFERFISSSISLYFDNAFRMNSYLDGTYSDVNQTSLFSFLFIVKITFICICLLYWRNINYQNRFFVFLSALSCSFYMILSFNSVLALRISELFILFSLATFVIPLQQKFNRIEYQYIMMIFILVLGFIFCYSSHKILLGY